MYQNRIFVKLKIFLSISFGGHKSSCNCKITILSVSDKPWEGIGGVGNEHACFPDGAIANHNTFYLPNRRGHDYDQMDGCGVYVLAPFLKEIFEKI